MQVIISSALLGSDVRLVSDLAPPAGLIYLLSNLSFYFLVLGNGRLSYFMDLLRFMRTCMGMLVQHGVGGSHGASQFFEIHWCRARNCSGTVKDSVAVGDLVLSFLFRLRVVRYSVQAIH